jgi:hypothetical protein
MKTNYLAVAACILVNMGLGMFWYGILKSLESDIWHLPQMYPLSIETKK